MPKDAPGETLYLEDLEVGTTFRSGEHRLDEEQIIAFATQFDPQPFHLDPVAAKDTFFQGLAASGWHTMGITMKLIVESMPLSSGLIGAGGEVSWPSPTRPEDVLHVESTVLEVKPSRSKPGQALVTIESLTSNQSGELRQRFVARVLAFSRPD